MIGLEGLSGSPSADHGIQCHLALVRPPNREQAEYISAKWISLCEGCSNKPFLLEFGMLLA